MSNFSEMAKYYRQRAMHYEKLAREATSGESRATFLAVAASLRQIAIEDEGAAQQADPVQSPPPAAGATILPMRSIAPRDGRSAPA